MRVDCSLVENFFNEKERLCEAQEKCDGCVLCGADGACLYTVTKADIVKIAKIVQKWSDEHQQITNLDYLLKHFPNTKLDEEGIPDEICPDSIGLPLADGMVCKGNAVDCKKCWSRLYEEK